MSESIIKCFGIPVYTEVLSDNTVSFIHQEVSEATNTTMFLKPGVQKLNEKSGQLGHIISSNEFNGDWILEKECRKLNCRFFTFHQKKRPYIILKWAESKDGFIAPKDQNEKYWLSHPLSKQLVHQWRAQEQSILIGVNTAVIDNPKLNLRDWYGKNPIPIVIDPKNRLPNESFLYRNNKANNLLLITSKEVNFKKGELKPKDFDIATDATPNEVRKIFKASRIIGRRFRLVHIYSRSELIEVATFRSGDTNSDGELIKDGSGKIVRDNIWGNLNQDTFRRDFTINAIYMDINGKLYDPQMGTVDLKNKNIKFIGDPQKRIEEDYLRIVRFIRFKVMYDIAVEPTTSDAIKQNLDGIQKISKERILIELLKILSLKNFLTINQSSNLREIFSMIFPEFLYLNRLERLKKIYQSVSYTHLTLPTNREV